MSSVRDRANRWMNAEIEKKNQETRTRLDAAAQATFSQGKRTSIYDNEQRKRAHQAQMQANRANRPTLSLMEKATGDIDRAPGKYLLNNPIQKPRPATIRPDSPKGQVLSTMAKQPGLRSIAQDVSWKAEQEAKRKQANKALSPGEKAVAWLGDAAGDFNRVVTSGLDMAANLLPNAEAALFGGTPEGTFTGQVLKPVTDATGKLKNYVDTTDARLDQTVNDFIGDNPVLRTLSDVGQGVVTALPNTVLALMSGGASLPAQLGTQSTGLLSTASAALQTMVKNPLYWSSVAQTIGPSYEAAKAKGASEMEATLTAVISSGLGSMVEVGGGVETLPGALRGADTGKVLNWVRSSLEEGGEEVVQGVLERMTNKAVYDKNRPMFSITDENAVFNPVTSAREGAMGTAVGGILGGGQVLTDTMLNLPRTAPTREQFDAAAMETLNQNKAAPDVQTETAKPIHKMSMEDFTNSQSSVWRNVDLDDLPTQQNITQQVHQEMVGNGSIVVVPDSTRTQVEESFPDLRTMNKSERTPILRQKMNKLKSDIRTFLNGIKGTSFEFEVNGNILDAKLYDTGVREVMEKITQNKASMLLHSDEVFRNARYLYSTPDYDGNPNIYRWNYFYTPVQIGEDILGVRIAVRDMVKTKDSQIYNWNIKPGASLDGGGGGNSASRAGVSSDAPGGASLDGGGRGQNRISSGVSSDAPNTHIPQPNNPVNRENVGDMGAKTSDFTHAVKQSQTAANTIGKNEAAWGVPEDARTDGSYDARTEQESLNNARMRLEQDAAGEMEALRRASIWSDEEVDMGMMILGELRQSAKETDDWSQFMDWAKVVKEHGVSAGQGLQAWAKYTRMTADGIMKTAAETLDNADAKTDNAEVLRVVSDFADRFERANTAKDVDELCRIIRDTSHLRRTGSFFKNEFSRQMNWALDRVAALASQELATQKKAAPANSEPQFAVGDTVMASDRGNYGKVVADNGDGTYQVHFVSKEGNEATVTLEASMMQNQTNRSGHTSATALDASGGSYYTFLRNFAAAGIENIAGDHTKTSVGDAVKTIRYNNMLSKFATTMRNLVGNGFMDLEDTFARDISVPFDMLLSRMTGTRSVAADRYYFSQAKRKGSMDGLAMALMEVGLDVDASGATNKYERKANRTFHMSGNVLARLMSSWEKWIGYNLTVTDEFKKGGISAEVQRGIDALYDKGKIKDDSLKDAGQQEAKYRTFQDDTALSKAMGGVRNALNYLGGAGDLLMPFTKVPSNLPMRAMEHSPIGLAKSLVDMGRVLWKAKNGTLTAAEQAKAVQGIGRGLTGSAVIAGFTALALKGIIRVASPGGTEENKDKTAAEKGQGLSGSQLNVSALLRWADGQSTEWQDGDQLISIGFLDPFNAHMNTAALIAEDVQNGELTARNTATDSLAGVIGAVLELPVMGVLSDAYNSFQYSDGENFGEKALDAAKTYAAGQVSSFVLPNSVQGLAQGLDDTQRDAYSSESLGEQVLDRFKAGIPGLRNTLPAKLDSYGREMKNEGGVMNFLNSNLNPGTVTTYHEDALERATRMLFEGTGSASIYPSRKAPNSISSDGESVELDSAQQRQYQQTRGQTEYAAKDALIADENYKALGSDIQVKAMEIAETYAKEAAKVGLNIGYEPDEAWVSDLEGADMAEIVKTVLGKAMDSVGGYGDKEQLQNYRSEIYSITRVLTGSDVQDKAMEIAQQFNDAVAKEAMGYAMETEWMRKAKELKTDKERVELFLGNAIDALAKEAGDGKKYDGLGTLMEAGTISGDIAVLTLPEKSLDAYVQYVKPSGASAEQWVDVCVYYNSLEGGTDEKKEKTSAYIDKMNISDSRKVALTQALYYANQTYYSKGPDVPNAWLADHGADDIALSQMTENQNEMYNKYIKPYGVEMSDYLDVMEFKGDVESTKDADGKTTYSKQKKVIDYLDSKDLSNEQKIALFLALYDSAKNIPYWWK